MGSTRARLQLQGDGLLTADTIAQIYCELAGALPPA
ncbi:hypothetical protein HNR15_001839 [Allobranchiibius huperziae]|uniref:Uncharacterized protein n=1 Tax=Allobranchiibius huperziae TaxID=1874116 RepID=A0A853DBE1_9MICO|nr:hypothetical protein [Allobranchiibius huperziae]